MPPGVEDRRVLPEQSRGERHDHMAGGKHLAPGQIAVVAEDFGGHLADALPRQSFDATASPGGIRYRRRDLLHRPTCAGQLGPPAGDQAGLAVVLLG